MWSPLIEAGSGNLALLHCSCLHACLAAYSNILRRDLNTTCITTVLTAAWEVTAGTEEVWLIHGSFWSKPAVKIEIKTHERWLVLVKWSARLNTSKVAANHRHLYLHQTTRSIENTMKIKWIKRRRKIKKVKINIHRKTYQHIEIKPHWWHIKIQEDRSSQWEAIRRDPWGFRQQGWSTPTEIDINHCLRRLFDISSA